ncbi:MAG: hypothetical protein AAGE59_36090 [Cyanobacteria bacterium P01_F01_bin.86]
MPDLTKKKKKKRRRSLDDSDIDSSTANRSRQSSDLRRSRTTDDLATTRPDPDFNPRQARDSLSTIDATTSSANGNAVRRSRSSSDADTLRQRRLDIAQRDDTPRSKTTDDLDLTVRRDRNEQADATTADLPTPIQRRKSLADLAATIDPEATVPDQRPARFRSQSVDGDSSAFRAKRLQESDVDTLLDDLDQIDPKTLPLVKELSLDDSSQDKDDEDFVEDTTTSADADVVAVRRSSYSQNQSDWTPLPKAADEALKALRDDFADASDAAFGPESYLTELLPTIYAQNDQDVSREMLNDVYYLAKEQIAQTIDNPLINDNMLSEAEKQRIQKMIDLVNAIDKIEGREAFLVPENAQAYNAYKLDNTNFGDTSLTAYERQIVQTYGNDLTGISFNRTQQSSEIHKAISDYRQAVMNRLTTDLEAVEAVFKAKFIKKKKHKNVLKADIALLNAIDRVKFLKDNLTDPNTTDAIDQLNLAVTAMRTAAQTYVATSNHADRIKACQKVLDRIDQLMVTDDKIISGRLDESFSTIERVHSALLKISPEVARTFSDDMETLFFNASPEATAQTVTLDSLGVALGLAGLDSSAASTTAFSNAEAVSTGLGIDSVASALLLDMYKAYSFIKELKDANVITKQNLLDGGVILTNTTKNVSAAIKTGIDIADATTGVSSAALTAASAAGTATGVASTVLGAGFTVHGGLITYKTQVRLGSATGIDDANIRAQIIARIKTKRRRALMEAVGGTVAVVGGVLVIVGTAGTAAPVVAGIGAAIGVSLAAERGGRAAFKTAKGTKGKKREELAKSVFIHMNALLASGNYSKAKELAQALTNNKLKQSLMLQGADAGASKQDQQAALVIMRDKLKTW